MHQMGYSILFEHPILIGESVDIIHISSERVSGSGRRNSSRGCACWGDLCKPLERKQNRLQLEERFQEIENLKQRLERENIYSRRRLNFWLRIRILWARHCDEEGPNQAEQVAGTDSTFFCWGKPEQEKNCWHGPSQDEFAERSAPGDGQLRLLTTHAD